MEQRMQKQMYEYMGVQWLLSIAFKFSKEGWLIK